MTNERAQKFHNRSKEAGNRLSTIVLSIGLGGTAVYFSNLTTSNVTFSASEELWLVLGLFSFVVTVVFSMIELHLDSKRYFLAASNLKDDAEQPDWATYNRMKKWRLRAIWASYISLLVAMTATTVFLIQRLL